MSAEEASLRLLAKKHALINAVQYGGKASAKAVMGKVFAERPDLKAKAREVKSIVEEVVEEVNKLSLEQQKALMQELGLSVPEKKPFEEREELPPLPNAEEYDEIVTRFAPNPDGPLTLGNARAAVVNDEYAKMYDGVFLLRFEDTDPKTKPPLVDPVLGNAYEMIKEDLKWLKCEWRKPAVVQSDRLEVYYEYAEKLLKMGYAYVCTCDRETFSRLLQESKPCPCRELPKEEHLDRWRRMLDRNRSDAFAEGEAVVRIKTDLKHPNPSVRDWAALRIINVEKHPHPRTGTRYWVWPLYNFACAIDDMLLGVTHVIRAKEHLVNTEKQSYIFFYLGAKMPTVIHHGKIKLPGIVLSKSKTLAAIREGKCKGWDDPKLGTLRALKRRGFLPEAVRQLMIKIGAKPTDITVSWEIIYAINRKLVDPVAPRFFFIKNPALLRVREVPSREVQVSFNRFPSRDRALEARYEIVAENGEIELLVPKEDLRKQGSVIRLMHLFNVKLEGMEGTSAIATYHSKSVDEAPASAPIIQWLLPERTTRVVLVRPEGLEEGLSETDLREVSVGTVVQFMRYCFARVDEKQSEKVVAYYAHD